MIDINTLPLIHQTNVQRFAEELRSLCSKRSALILGSGSVLIDDRHWQITEANRRRVRLDCQIDPKTLIVATTKNGLTDIEIYE